MDWTIIFATIAFGLAYEYIYIIKPADLSTRLTPIVTFLEWTAIGVITGYIAPRIHEQTDNLSWTLVITVFSVMLGASIGHLTLMALRRWEARTGKRAYRQAIDEWRQWNNRDEDRT